MWRALRSLRVHLPWWIALCAVPVMLGCGPDTNETRVLLGHQTQQDVDPQAKAAAVELLDLEGRRVELLGPDHTGVSVFIFTRTDCPIANALAPEIQRIAQTFGQRGVKFYLVYPNPDVSVEEIRQHLDEYGLTLTALRDPHHALVERSGASITPEAAVFTSRRELAYCGRINDRFVDFGKKRPEATRHDLRDALESVLDETSATITTKRTPAVGCYIRDLR